MQRKFRLRRGAKLRYRALVIFDGRLAPKKTTETRIVSAVFTEFAMFATTRKGVHGVPLYVRVAFHFSFPPETRLIAAKVVAPQPMRQFCICYVYSERTATNCTRRTWNLRPSPCRFRVKYHRVYFPARWSTSRNTSLKMTFRAFPFAI